MKKLILALIGLGLAFVISSCGEQGQFSGNMPCDNQCRQQHMEYRQQQIENAQQQGWVPGQGQQYSNQGQQQSQERPYRRW